MRLAASAAVAVAVAVATLAALASVAVAPPAVPLPPLARHATAAGPAAIATLPGAVLELTAVPAPPASEPSGSSEAGGTLAVLLSSDADNGPRSVVLIALRSGEVTTLAERLPEDLATIAALPDGDLVVGDGERLYRLAEGRGSPREPAALVPLDAARGADPRAVGLAAGPGRPVSAPRWLAVARAGRLELLGPAGAVEASIEVPVETVRRRWGLEVLAPRVTILPVTSETAKGEEGASPRRSGALWASGPYPVEPSGPGAHRRLRTILGALPGGGSREVWSRLPGDEYVADASYGRLDGRPALAVGTVDRIGLLAKRACRLFVLGTGGSAASGAPPILAFETRAALWHEIDLVLADADGDAEGRTDLVLVHPQGLDGDELRLEVHRRRPGSGGFSRPVATVLDGPAAAWHYGDDLDGDRLPDLVVARDGTLSLHPGARRGRRPVAPRAAWELPLDGSGSGREIRLALAGERGPAGAPSYRLALRRVLDADGDGSPEIVLVGPPADGWSRLAVVGTR